MKEAAGEVLLGWICFAMFQNAAASMHPREFLFRLLRRRAKAFAQSRHIAFRGANDVFVGTTIAGAFRTIVKWFKTGNSVFGIRDWPRINTNFHELFFVVERIYFLS
ncbi:MAG: hypothetical protein U0Y68_21150 [Blastocatellia bacterium]